MSTTVVTTHGTVTVPAADYWARDADGDVHLYPTDDETRNDDSLLTVEAARFVVAFDTDKAHVFEPFDDTPDR